MCGIYQVLYQEFILDGWDWCWKFDICFWKTLDSSLMNFINIYLKNNRLNLTIYVYWQSGTLKSCGSLQKEENGKIVNILPSTQNNFEQSGLGPGQEYEVSLRAIKNNTKGPQTTRTFSTSESSLCLRACTLGGSGSWNERAAVLLRHLSTIIPSRR